MAVYIGIMVVGFLVIIIIWLGENKSQKTSPVDLLNSLDVDEDPQTLKPSAKPSASFLNRLSMENDAPKVTTSEPIDPAKDALERSAADFEVKLKDPAEPPQDPKSTL